MVKARLNNGIALLGLTDINIDLLKQGKPIKINLEVLGLPPQVVVIMYGETEMKIVKEVTETLDQINPFNSLNNQN